MNSGNHGIDADDASATDVDKGIVLFPTLSMITLSAGAVVWALLAIVSAPVRKTLVPTVLDAVSVAVPVLSTDSLEVVACNVGDDVSTGSLAT